MFRCTISVDVERALINFFPDAWAKLKAKQVEVVLFQLALRQYASARK